MKALFAALIALSSASAIAATKLPDYTTSRDLSKSCAETVLRKMLKDDEVSGYLDVKTMTVSLEWWDNSKEDVSFTFNFDEDVRDGYMMGQVSVKLASDGSCKAGEVHNTSVGD